MLSLFLNFFLIIPIFSLTSRIHMTAWFPREQCFPVAEKNVAQIVGYNDGEVILRTCDKSDCIDESCMTIYQDELKYEEFFPNVFAGVMEVMISWSLRFLQLSKDPPNLEKNQFVLVGFATKDACEKNKAYGTVYFLYSSENAHLLTDQCMKAGRERSYSCTCSEENEMQCQIFQTDDCSGESHPYGFDCDELFRMYCGPYGDLHNPNEGFLVDLSYDGYSYIDQKSPIFMESEDLCFMTDISAPDDKDYDYTFTKQLCRMNHTTNHTDICAEETCQSEIYQPFDYQKNVPLQYNFLYVLFGSQYYAIQDKELIMRDVGGEYGRDIMFPQEQFSGTKDRSYIYNDASFYFCKDESKKTCLENGTVVESLYDNFKCEGEPISTRVADGMLCGTLYPRIEKDDLVGSSHYWVIAIFVAVGLIVLVNLLCCCFFCCCVVCCSCLWVCCASCLSCITYIEKRRGGYRQIN